MARTVRGMRPCCPQKVAICKCKIIAETSEENLLLEMYDKLNRDQRNRLLGYIEALAETK